jgi:hypothetical protein
MIFLWTQRSEEHLSKHEVTPTQAVFVVDNAESPYPQEVGESKYAVRGQTAEGRYLHVVFVYAAVENIELEEYERLTLPERLAMEEGVEAGRIIHARDLSEAEKRRVRRRKRG